MFDLSSQRIVLKKSLEDSTISYETAFEKTLHNKSYCDNFLLEKDFEVYIAENLLQSLDLAVEDFEKTRLYENQLGSKYARDEFYIIIAKREGDDTLEVVIQFQYDYERARNG
jgi:hypothetical protein